MSLTMFHDFSFFSSFSAACERASLSVWYSKHTLTTRIVSDNHAIQNSYGTAATNENKTQGPAKPLKCLSASFFVMSFHLLRLASHFTKQFKLKSSEILKKPLSLKASLCAKRCFLKVKRIAQQQAIFFAFCSSSWMKVKLDNEQRIRFIDLCKEMQPM